MTTTVIYEGFPLTIHGWDSWVDPRHPVTGPPMTWGDNHTMAMHYTAAVNLVDGDFGEFQSQIPAYLRAIHLDYLTHRPQPNGATGYSIGYNWAVDWLGGLWRLRGWDIKCAANQGWNEWTFACLCLVDGADPLTDLALRSVRYLHRTGEAYAGRALSQRPHSQLRSDGTLTAFPGDVTGCPGNGIRGQLAAGKTNWRYVDPSPPEPPVPPETHTTALLAAASGDDMIRFIQDAAKPVSDQFRWASNGLVKMVPTADQAAWLIQRGLASNTLTTPDRLPLAVINQLPSIN